MTMLYSSMTVVFAIMDLFCFQLTVFIISEFAVFRASLSVGWYCMFVSQCVYYVMSGEMLNVNDAYAHPNFFSGIDEMTGFKTRSVIHGTCSLSM